MKFISDNCEEHLYAKVRSLKEVPHNSWRCLYFHHKGMAANRLRSRWLTVVLPALNKTAEGYIYLCADGDVFILFQGQASAALGELSKQFADFVEKPYAIFDLSVHWQLFYRLCKSKYVHAQLMQDMMPALKVPPAHDTVFAGEVADGLRVG